MTPYASVKIPTELLNLISRQTGVVTRQQALSAGVTPAALRHAIGPRGPWQRIMPGIYATFTGPLQHEHRLLAAMLNAGRDSALTGAHACKRYGMVYAPAGGTIEVLLPQSVIRRPPSFARYIRTSAMPATRTVRGVREEPSVVLAEIEAAARANSVSRGMLEQPAPVAS